MAILALLLSFSGYAVVLPGTTVLGIDLGWLPVRKAEQVLLDRLDWSSRTVTLCGEDVQLEASLAADLGVLPDVAATVAACRRPLWLLSRSQYPLVISVDQTRLASFARDLSLRLARSPRDAKLTIVPGDEVKVVPDSPGRALDVAAFQNMFYGGLRLHSVPGSIQLPVVEVHPRVRASDLEPFLPLRKIASFTTYYTSGNDRAFNIGLACASLKEVFIGPREVFSFNSVVGARAPERGYRKAPTFVGEDTVDDYGGGVCQVSTTVYVALLQAGFQVVERYCHSKPVDYVPLGLDATVVYDYLDLKMANAGDGPCLLRVTASDGALTADVFGKLEMDLRIEVESLVLKEIPPEGLGATGDPGGSGGAEKPLRSGFLVETIRRYIRGGQLQRVEKLGTSMYPPEKPRLQSSQPR